jgi:hypothetical protein
MAEAGVVSVPEAAVAMLGVLRGGSRPDPKGRSDPRIEGALAVAAGAFNLLQKAVLLQQVRGFLLSVVHRRLSGRFADDRLVDVRADRVDELEGDGVAGPDFDPCVLLRVRLCPLDVDLPALADGRMRIGSRDKEPFADLRSVSAQRGLGALAQGVCRPNRFEGVRPPNLACSWAGSATASDRPAARVTSRDRPASACGRSASDD